MEEFKIIWRRRPYHLSEFILQDENGVELNLNEFFNSLTLAMKTIEKRLEALDGISGK